MSTNEFPFKVGDKVYYRPSDPKDRWIYEIIFIGEENAVLKIIQRKNPHTYSKNESAFDKNYLQQAFTKYVEPKKIKLYYGLLLARVNRTMPTDDKDHFYTVLTFRDSREAETRYEFDRALKKHVADLIKQNTNWKILKTEICELEGEDDAD